MFLTGVQRKRNREGKPWAAMQLEDLQGTIEAALFSNNYERLQGVLTEDQAVMVKGAVLPEEGAPPKISIQDIVPLHLAGLRLPSLISIRVRLAQNGAPADDKAAALSHLFERKPGDSQVRLRLENPRDFSVILDLEAKVRPDREFQAEVERICGPESFEVSAV